jgi:hypothetical protein
MPLVWEFRDKVLAVVERGVVTNEEIDRVFVGQALSDTRVRLGTRLLWDACESETPLSADEMAWRIDLLASLGERGLVSRVALLVRAEQHTTIALGQSEVPKALPALPFAVFTEEAGALAWLLEQQSA